MNPQDAKDLRNRLISISKGKKRSSREKREFLSVTDSIVKLDLSLVSSIMNYCGYEGLLNYLSVYQFKTLDVCGDRYVNYSKNFKEFSFFDNESKWIHSMDKLVKMKLAVKNGDFYTIRTKLKDWNQFAKDNTKSSLKFHGYICFNMTRLYQKRNKDCNLKDLIYLSLVDNVIKGKSISRGWKKELTGISHNEQRTIEKRNEDNLQVMEHFIPVSEKETRGGKVGSKLVVPGKMDHNRVKFKEFEDVGEVNVFQIGNKTYLKPHMLISEFKRKKGFKVQKESDLNRLNNSLRDKDEVHWKDLSAVIDTSTDREDKSFRFVKLLNVQDNRKKTWKIFSRIDFSKVLVLTPKGYISPLRRYINCYS